MAKKPTPTPAPAQTPAGNGWLKGLLVAALLLACMFAGLLIAQLLFGSGNATKIGPLTGAPVPVVQAPPPAAPAVPPQTAKVTVTPQGVIVVDGVNPSRSGVVQNVTVQLPACSENCPPRMTAPRPCVAGCARPAPLVRQQPLVYRPAPVVRPQPRVYRQAPARASTCAVRVDVFGPPTRVDVKDATGRVVGSANVVGSGRVAVPCGFARAGSGQICLVTGGANAPARTLNPEWFSIAKRNLGNGNTLLNAGHPVWFRKGGQQ